MILFIQMQVQCPNKHNKLFLEVYMASSKILSENMKIIFFKKI